MRCAEAAPLTREYWCLRPVRGFPEAELQLFNGCMSMKPHCCSVDKETSSTL